MEGETLRVMYEQWFVKYKVDVVFAGHVHAYERSVKLLYSSLILIYPSLFTQSDPKVMTQERVSNIAYNIVNGLCEPLVPDELAPVYITIGDGGNSEGLLTE